VAVDPHLVPRLRMCGAIPQLPVHGFMTLTGITLLLPVIYLIKLSLTQTAHHRRRSCWLCCLRRSSEAVVFLISGVRILLRAWVFVCCVCCVGSGLCIQLITRVEESYRLSVCVCLIVCDIATSKTDGLVPIGAAALQTQRIYLRMIDSSE
jgi:hypothetical protein